MFGSTEKELRPSSNFHLLPLEEPTAGEAQEKQIRAHNIFPEVKDEAWDATPDDLIEHDGEKVLGNQMKQEDGFEDELEGKKLEENTERNCLMSLDITEEELQRLEQQAQEKHLTDVTCTSPEVLNTVKSKQFIHEGGWLIFSIYGQRVNILGFADHLVSAQFCQFGVKAAVDQQPVCMLIKLYLQKQKSRLGLACELLFATPDLV